MNPFKVLAAASGQKIVTREIEFLGETQTVHFRRISGDEADQLNLMFLGDDGKLDKNRMVGNVSRQLAISMCDEQGKPLATAEEIGAEDIGLRTKLFEAFEDANGLKVAGKDQPAANDSGSSSPSGSGLAA